MSAAATEKNSEATRRDTGRSLNRHTQTQEAGLGSPIDTRMFLEWKDTGVLKNTVDSPSSLIKHRIKTRTTIFRCVGKCVYTLNRPGEL